MAGSCAVPKLGASNALPYNVILNKQHCAMTSILEYVRSLALPTGEYVVFGSAPLYAHRLVERIEHDADIVAMGAAWKRACTLGKVVKGTYGDCVVTLFDGLVEIYDGWSVGGVALDIPVLIASAEFFDTPDELRGLPFARLEEVLAFKRRINRPKDAAHIALIEEYLDKKYHPRPYSPNASFGTSL